MSIEAMKQALEALNEVTGWQWAGPMRVMDEVDDAITSLRQAIQEEALRNVQRIGQEIEQEPVAWIDNSGHPRHISYVQSISQRKLYGALRPLYTHPQPKREWIGLTDEEIEMVIDKVSREVGYYPSAWDMVSPRTLIAAVIEAAHGLKEKNT